MKLPKLSPRTAPATVEDDAELKRAIELRETLTEQRAGLARRISELEELPSAAALSVAVDKVLNGTPVEQADAGLDTRPQLHAARQHLAVVEAAIKVAEQRERTARAKAIKAYREAHLERFRVIARKGAEAAIAMGRAQEEAREFALEQLAAGAGDWPVAEYGPLGFGRVGDPEQQLSLFGSWLISAIRAGAIDESIVPSEWLRNWNSLNDRDPERSRARIAVMANDAKRPSARVAAAQRMRARG